MESETLISALVFFVLFFGTTAVLQLFSKKSSFPFTVALLIAGFIAQIFVYSFGLEAELHLSPETIFYLILPILLFEAAMHINIHQFKIQFLTISFISTFGLLISMGVVAAGLSYFIGMPIQVALLFGALISATDPIAVLSIFKSLGAPKRLSLIADGESMFNDATAVIAYKIVAGFVFASSYLNTNQFFESFGNFAYMFFGSIIFGIIIGYIASDLVKRVKNDHLVELTITLSLALGSFIIADHYFGLSGVITTVMAGVAFGNLGKTRISETAHSFVNEAWELLSFLSVALVFFFAAFQLDLGQVLEYSYQLPFVIGSVLVARAVSVYLSFWISNTLPFFKDEPDVPLRWQHILNWGGLRGVIPLVLAYSIPNDFQYKEEIIAYTLATFIFTLLVNALTIRSLLVRLGLHLPKKEEEIIDEELHLFEIEQKRALLKNLPEREFFQDVVKSAEKKLVEREQYYKQLLLSHASTEELEISLRLQAIEISRMKTLELFRQGFVNESVLYDYETQLDIQQDSLEYPEVYKIRGVNKEGRFPHRKLYRDRLRSIQKRVRNFPYLKKYFGFQENELVEERLMSLKVKISCVEEVLIYLERVRVVFKGSKPALGVIKKIEGEYFSRREEYEKDIYDIKQEFPQVVKEYQLSVVSKLLS